MYLYSANTRINLTCPECSKVGISMEVNHHEKEFVILVVLRHTDFRENMNSLNILMQDRTFYKFIIITVIVLLEHD
jgi:hypothetical protein